MCPPDELRLHFAVIGDDPARLAADPSRGGFVQQASEMGKVFVNAAGLRRLRNNGQTG